MFIPGVKFWQVAFYLNDKPVVEFSDLPQHEVFWPSVVFGAPGYLVQINPVPRLPLGITRWNEDALQPYRCNRSRWPCNKGPQARVPLLQV